MAEIDNDLEGFSEFLSVRQNFEGQNDNSSVLCILVKNLVNSPKT